MLAQVKDSQYFLLFMLAVATGMRQGELFGLKWGDIDWENAQIRVSRTFTHGRFYNPKSKTSRRNIDLTPEILLELKKWRLSCPKNDLDLVFCNTEGKPLEPSHIIRHHFRPALEAAGLPLIRFHDL